MTATTRSIGLRTVALLEAGKGLIVLAAGFGVFVLFRVDAQLAAERLIAHLHLNPAHRYPQIFLRVATQATPNRVRLIALGAFLYASIRLIEAAGLWRERRWAEWLGTLTGLVYVPFEVFALIRHPSIEPVIALIANIGIVIFLARRLWLDSPAET